MCRQEARHLPNVVTSSIDPRSFDCQRTSAVPLEARSAEWTMLHHSVITMLTEFLGIRLKLQQCVTLNASYMAKPQQRQCDRADNLRLWCGVGLCCSSAGWDIEGPFLLVKTLQHGRFSVCMTMTNPDQLMRWSAQTHCCCLLLTRCEILFVMDNICCAVGEACIVTKNSFRNLELQIVIGFTYAASFKYSKAIH